ncbi:hypothetical protein [Bartonella doshiae]|uniref:Uncharacterized protein n=2 Tax=Bartonella doshiae TaxID=33044 RepID=A0A380ZE97_BARDO|nr:hypothetical protein [Bartonella doshiae]EJF81130.1 hypothetical protein MCS_00843 [Bartonella doshiae NCTC 12862 = ATCC 700133]MBB6159160.1 type III secretory pathway component EscV [Bartonella doshiae]SUV45278.1 Uncharacterised protein [Bartonella doshiae]
MLIQSLLFFILGVASTSWLLVLFSPLIWRRALHLAQKFVSAQIPLSHIEIQANYDFLCAQHAVELVRNEQKYKSLQKKYAQQKMQLGQATEQLYRLLLPTQSASSSHEKETIEKKQNTLTKNTFIMEIKTMRKKIAHYQQRLKEIQSNELDSAANQQLIDKLREETKELAATLAAQIALQEGETSPINTLIQNSKDDNDLASCIRQKIANSKKTTPSR